MGTEKKVVSTVANASSTISAVALDSTRVFIAHSTGDNYYLYGIVCTISGTTITNGSNTAIDSTNTNSGFAISAVLAGENTVFIAHSYGSSYHLYGVICTISGTTPTAGTDNVISSYGRSGYVVSATMLSVNTVFIAHSYSSSYCLYGVVCTISGTTITRRTDTLIDDNSDAGSVISATTLGGNRVLIAHIRGLSGSTALYGVLCTISGTNITVGNTASISAATNSGSAISSTILSGDIVFIAHSNDSNYYLNGVVEDLEIRVKAATNPDAIQGMTRTECTTSTAGDVWVLDTT